LCKRFPILHALSKENGQIVESKERTGMWAWKHTHQADGSVDYIELKGDVVFDDVNFGYNPDKIVLHNVDLYATPGQKIAFVGSTGAGKTTITNLINRFYDIQDGKIRYDGININKIKKDLAAYIAVNEEHVDCAIDYLMIAKYLERLGDHAVNICEWVQFYKTGMHKSERIL